MVLPPLTDPEGFARQFTGVTELNDVESGGQIVQVCLYTVQAALNGLTELTKYLTALAHDADLGGTCQLELGFDLYLSAGGVGVDLVGVQCLGAAKLNVLGPAMLLQLRDHS